MFSVNRTNKLRVGETILVNGLYVINNLIPLEWLNLSYQTIKIKCKEKLLGLDSNIDSVILNNTYLNIIKHSINNLKNEQHQILKFDSYANSEIGVILS